MTDTLIRGLTSRVIGSSVIWLIYYQPYNKQPVEGCDTDVHEASKPAADHCHSAAWLYIPYGVSFTKPQVDFERSCVDE